MSGVAGADRIKSRQDFQQFLNSYKQVIAKFPGFVSIQPSGSFNSDMNKNDFGDIDLITHIKSTKNKKEVKLELVHFFEKLPDTQIVAFSSDKHAGKRSYNSGEIVTVRYHDDVLGYSAQIDNIIALDHIEAGFKQQFLDMPAEKQGLVLGLVKIATVETDPKQLFAKLNIKVPVNLQPNQEFEFNLSSSELQLRKVTYEPGTFKQADREILWRSQNYADLQKLLYQYDLSQGFDELLTASQSTIQNPRSKNRMQGVFGSMITVKSGEVGTAKGANKVAALDKIKNTFNESVFNALVESNGGTMVFAFGRFNPPTIGHELLVNTVTKTATAHKAAYAIFVSRTQDKKKNPLPLGSKLHYLKQAFPGVHFVGASDEVRTFMEAAKSFDGKFKNLIMVAGGDRISVFEETLHKYNHIEYNFDNIQVVSAGARDPDSDEASGASGTKMREYAANNDLKSFIAQLPRTIDEHTAQQMMNEIRLGMGIKQEQPMAESRLQELIAETKRMSAAVKLQKAYQREQEKSSASRERGNNILNPKKASETPKPVGAGSGSVKMSEDHQTSRLWMMISNLEKQAKLTKNDLKRDHLLKMANDLRAKLPTNDMAEARANTASVRAGLAKRNKKPLSPEEQRAKDAAKFEKWKAKNQKPEVAEGDVVQFPKKHKGDITNMHSCPKCGGDLQGGKYMGHQVRVCMPCKQVYLPPNSGIDHNGNKIQDEGFDAAEFNRHMEKLRAREELRKTDPMRALVGDMIDKDNANRKPVKKQDDDSMSINDPRHPGWSYTEIGSHQNHSTDEDISRRGFLKGAGAAAAGAAAGNAGAVAMRMQGSSKEEKEANARAKAREAEEQAKHQAIVKAYVDILSKGQPLPPKMQRSYDTMPDFRKEVQAALAKIPGRPGEVDYEQRKNYHLMPKNESKSNTMASTAKRLTDPNDGKTAKLRAAGDKRREDQLKGRDIAKRNESTMKEFAPDDNGGGGEEDILHKYARMWYNGDLPVQQKVEKVLDRMGWEIGEIESEEGGCFVVKSGDEHGRSYIGFAPEDLSDGNLKEFAPGNGGESGRWYTDDDMTNIVGDGWWNDLDVSGDISKQEMIQEAQAWLNDQGYSVQVLNCKLNDDDMEWYIEGSFINPNFAKKGVAEEKQRLDPKCWKGYKKQGTKMKGDTRVNNCVPIGETAENILGRLIRILESK